MRKINKVFIHCSASDHAHHDNVDTIRAWHVLERGFNDIGYHYIITKDGTVHNGRPVWKPPAAQKGHNEGSIAICLTGNDIFSQKQFNALRGLCGRLNREYNVTFHGHREVNKHKTCPNFEYKSLLNLDLDGRMPRLDLKNIKTKSSFFDRFIDWIEKIARKL